MQLGRPIHRYNVVGSTNDILRDLAREGAVHGTTVVARRQTDGRGRRGRVWWSPSAENLYLSVLMRPSRLEPSRLPAVAPATGLAVAEALADLIFAEPLLKWPNDVLINGKKVAGVLAESVLSTRSAWAVVGIGINVNVPDFPPELADRATSLRKVAGREMDVAVVEARVLARLTVVWETFLRDGFASLMERWNTWHAQAGHEVTVSDGLGGESIRGVALGVDAMGALQMEIDGRRRRVTAGEVA